MTDEENPKFVKKKNQQTQEIDLEEESYVIFIDEDGHEWTKENLQDLIEIGKYWTIFKNRIEHYRHRFK